MERKFYPENFERFLREHADQFKMTPSKKVWHGIYNDLHPGRKWPSTAMSIIFIFTLVIVGHLNTNNGHNSPLNDLSSFQLSKSNKSISIDKSNQSGKNRSASIISNTASGTSNNNLQQQLSFIKINTPEITATTLALPTSKENLNNNVALKNTTIEPDYTAVVINGITESIPSENNNSLNNITFNSIADNTTLIKENEILNSDKETKAEIIPQANAANIRKPRRTNNITWSYYFSPSISYRFLSDDKINNAVIHKAIVGYEASTEMSFKILKNLQFTSGLQLNYTGYKIKANNTHPIIASLILNTENQGQFEIYSAMSHYGNGTGSEYTRLKNYSIQLSLPIGLRYEFGGNDNFKFGAASTFQPSYNIANNAYLLSDDKKNYLTDPFILRKWNMNTSLSTFISFTSNNLKWQIGPQVRYQLLSTYSNRYAVKEHLINYGIRVGISNISK